MANNIRLLDDKTINKIAAGEVIERPASVVKELVENSIDANSSTIIIEIKSGGKKYIRITDDGSGINKDDIELAFLRHSTSKITSVDDLERVTSLGFRGEALASISAISQLEIITRTQENIGGFQARFVGGQLTSHHEVGCPYGTTIIVQNLFFNVPVRQKFLKSDNSEGSQISNIVYRLALSNPNISFKYIKDDKLIVKTPGDGNIENTIYSLFGKELVKSLFKVNYDGDDIKIKGLVSKPSYTRGNRSYQYLFINGRYIVDRGLSKAIEEGYKSLLPINRFPAFVLYIDMDSSAVDVNVHPTKTEVRFEQSDRLFGIVSKAVKEVLNQHNLIPEVSITKEKKTVEEPQPNFLDDLSKLSKVNKFDNIAYTSKDPINEAKPLDSRIETNYVEEVQPSVNKLIDIKVFEEEPVPEDSYVKDIPKEVLPELFIIGNLFNTYILAQDTKNEEFYLIDQHAAHERIMFEKLMKQYMEEKVAIQELLAPEIIELSHSEIQLITEYGPIFERAGFLVESFGIKSVILRGVPLIFGEPDSRKLFLDILDKLSSNIQSSYELRAEKIIKMACTTAIKAGYNIKNIEIEKLISDLRCAQEPFTCPHGRPIIIKMTKYELEKKFKRVQ